MKKILFSATLVAASMVSLTSCDKSESVLSGVEQNETEQSELSVTTRIGSMTRSVLGRPIDAFTSGDEIGLFVSNGSVNTPYNGVAANKNVKSAFTTVWTQTPKVYLSSAQATVYAYYPYSSTVNDGTQVAIDHTSQTDYLYATPATGISNRRSTAALVMNHALSLVQFNLKTENYSGAGQLTAIKIANKSGGKSLISQGTLNIQTGAIAKGTSTEAVTKATNLPQTIGNWSENTYPKMLVLPTSATAAAGDIVISFTVDGQTYNWNVPANTAWEQGKKNTYTVTLRGTELVVSPVTIDPWDTGLNQSGTIQ